MHVLGHQLKEVLNSKNIFMLQTIAIAQTENDLLGMF